MTEREYTEDEERMFCAWSDYRKEYGAHGGEAHYNFKAGWEAARDNWTVNFDLHTMDWKAGFRAYYGNLDIGDALMSYSDIEEHAESLERELDETLRELTEVRGQLERTEQQIHEDGGFIDRIVELEAENEMLRATLRNVRSDLLVMHALLNPPQPCTCGYGGFHEEGNPDCDRNEDA